MDMDKPYNKSYKSKAKDYNYSVLHWNPDYARAYPKGIGRLPTLLDPLEAKQYGMVNRWNKVTKKYDGTDKVLAIPNYLGVLGDSRRQPSIPSIWAPEADDPLPSACYPPTPSTETSPNSPATANFRPPIIGTPAVDTSTDPPPPPIIDTPSVVTSSDYLPPSNSPGSHPPTIFSPDIANGDLDGAPMEEFSGMRIEFTSKDWFDESCGLRNRRLFSWYGYNGQNMKWRQLMTLLTKVHFKSHDGMQFPTAEQRKMRCRGVQLTNLEKCLLTKMFLTTGLTFTKLADLWGCDEKTVRRAVKYWEPLWNEVSLKYCRLLVWDDYLKACQPDGWSRRYKHPISHMTDGSVVASNTPRKSSILGRLMSNNKINHCGALGITMSTPIGCGFLCMPLYCGRLSEVAYMSLHQRWFDIIPPNFARLVDKGFTRTSRYYLHGSFAYVPAFVRSDTKDLSGAALKEARKQSSDRYTCETYFARCKIVTTPCACVCVDRVCTSNPTHCMSVRVKNKSRLLKGECPHYHWKYLNTAWSVGHYAANLQRPLRRPSNFDSLEEQYHALPREIHYGSSEL